MAKKKQYKEIPAPKNRSQYVKLVKKGEHYHKNKDSVQALKYLTAAWKFDATDPNLLIMVADNLFKIGNKTAAMELMGYALLASPEDPVIVSILGNRAVEMEFFELGQKFHQKYIELRPDDVIGYNNYATALREDGKYDEAIEYLQNILPIFPSETVLWNTLASVVGYRDGAGNAVVFFEESLKLDPQNVQVLNNIAPAYAAINQLEKSEETIRKAIEIDPASSSPHMFLSAILLHSDRLAEGWKEYEWRHDLNQFRYTVKSNEIPYWNGEDLTGKKIFIYTEQGIGDEFLFAWLYKEIMEDAEEVGLGCAERLVPLFKSSFPNSEVSRTENRINKALDIKFQTFPDIDLTKYDYQVVAGDLTKHKWKKTNDIKPTIANVFSADATMVDHWKERLDELPHDISIGVAWRSGIQLAKRARNYTSLLDWEPILKQKNVNFINVQYGDCEEELKELEEKTGIKIHTFEDLDLKDDFENTGALIQNCDLCIGPASAPLMQSTMSGIDSWFIMNGKPWWNFGLENPPWGLNASVHSKNDDDPWPEFMAETAKKFSNRIKDKRKSKK